MENNWQLYADPSSHYETFNTKLFTIQFQLFRRGTFSYLQSLFKIRPTCFLTPFSPYYSNSFLSLRFELLSFSNSIHTFSSDVPTFCGGLLRYVPSYSTGTENVLGVSEFLLIVHHHQRRSQRLNGPVSFLSVVRDRWLVIQLAFLLSFI